MNIIIIPDGHYITTVSEVNSTCEGCVFFNTDWEEDDVLRNKCHLDARTKLPCISTIYAVIPEDTL